MIFKDKETGWRVFAAIYTVPVILHTVGLYMLFTTRITRLASNQKIYLINISASELSICFLKIAHRLLSLNDQPWLAFKLWTIQTSGCFMAYILFMILLSVDRFLEVYLNIKYQLYITSRTARISVISAWTVSLTFSLILVLQNSTDLVRRIVIVYFWPSSELTFLFIAIIVYTYLFVKIRHYRRKTRRVSVYPGVSAGNHQINATTVHSTTFGDYTSHVANVNTTGKTNKGKNRSNRQKQYRKKLYLPTLLVLSFIFLWIVPDQVEFVAMVMDRGVPPYFWFLINVLITCAVCVDAVIYIFGVREIKNRILKKTSCCRFKATPFV